MLLLKYIFVLKIDNISASQEAIIAVYISRCFLKQKDF